MKRNKISFCTVSMNRLIHFQSTLERNLKDNDDYPNFEIVLLDYNSSDGLENWAISKLTEHITSGKIVFYRTEQPKYFHRSHSRNICFRLASGDILCNVDADNYTGSGFASYVDNIFEKYSDIYLASSLTSSNDVLGRVCVKKSHFFSVSGYDESMEGYGFEDIDLRNRLKKLVHRRINKCTFYFLFGTALSIGLSA